MKIRAVLITGAALGLARPAHAGMLRSLSDAFSGFVCALPFAACEAQGPDQPGPAGGGSGPVGNPGPAPQNPNAPAAPDQVSAAPGGDSVKAVERVPKPAPTTTELGDPKHTSAAPSARGVTVVTDWGECVAVVNRRSDKRTVAIPFLKRDEFDNFKAKARSNGLDVYPCYCARALTAAEIHRGIQQLDPNHSEPSLDLRAYGPEFGQEPDYFVDQATIDQLCVLLACGSATLLSMTKDASPEDNTRALFVGGTWVKRPAKPINRKIDHRRPTLSCALP